MDRACLCAFEQWLAWEEDTVVVGEAASVLTIGGLNVDLGNGLQGFAARLDATGAPIWLKKVSNAGSEMRATSQSPRTVRSSS